MASTSPTPPGAPIGVFDSGVGGLTVLAGIRRLLPQEPLLYVADSAHAPYGERDADFITARSLHIAQRLVDRGVKALVVACNTATVVAAASLRERFALPIVALEPAIKPAVAASRSGAVGVLATSRTLASASVQRLCAEHGGRARILLQPCPGLVEQVERGELDTPATRALLARHLAPLQAAGVDVLVLGCTHYPLLAPAIRALMGPQVRLIDSADAVARQLHRRLPAVAEGAHGHAAAADRCGSAGEAAAPAWTQALTSGDPAAVAPLVQQLWGSPLPVVSLDAGDWAAAESPVQCGLPRRDPASA